MVTLTVNFRVTVCLELGIGLGSLGELGLGEMGQNQRLFIC